MLTSYLQKPLAFGLLVSGIEIYSREGQETSLKLAIHMQLLLLCTHGHAMELLFRSVIFWDSLKSFYIQKYL